jgi:hypothetical protein
MDEFTPVFAHQSHAPTSSVNVFITHRQTCALTSSVNVIFRPSSEPCANVLNQHIIRFVHLHPRSKYLLPKIRSMGLCLWSTFLSFIIRDGAYILSQHTYFSPIMRSVRLCPRSTGLSPIIRAVHPCPWSTLSAWS